ncbi:unnamed protein product [Haemonchus placei]|uniref:Uncharacterized protein n=1 Tax=Haemonchus placei TaxID=6290 RepID=A0A0N4X1G9_HAEPC|nr:unnamed protein product [Haemonchus placei]
MSWDSMFSGGDTNERLKIAILKYQAVLCTKNLYSRPNPVPSSPWYSTATAATPLDFLLDGTSGLYFQFTNTLRWNAVGWFIKKRGLHEDFFLRKSGCAISNA